MIKVLFVCTGNICRSPTAEGVFREQVRGAGLDSQIQADSAGVMDYHVGQPPDNRAAAAALRRSVDIRPQRARRVAVADFDRFDLILAMDHGHLSDLLALCPAGRTDRVRMFLSFAPELGVRDVPDPYYGGPEGFEEVLDLVEAGSRGLLQHLRDTCLTGT